jgi:hypothetical protein
MHATLPMFGETYTVMENGKIVDYWCSNNQKVVVPQEYKDTPDPFAMIFCEESILSLFVTFNCGNPCTLVGPKVALLTLNYTNPMIDLFVCEQF